MFNVFELAKKIFIRGTKIHVFIIHFILILSLMFLGNIGFAADQSAGNAPADTETRKELYMAVMEQPNAVTMKGNPITLLGKQITVGQDAPDATLVANDLSEVKISSFKGQKVILSVVPSLDTGICDLQTKRFNKEAGSLGGSVKILTISMDLPFAQKRWCGATGSDKIQTLSDYRYASFGEAYGVLIKNLRLLTRAIFIIDSTGKIQYTQIVPEVGTEPNYDAVLNALKNVK